MILYMESDTPHCPPRHLPNEPLPAYRFLPGRNPHPTRDPRGHSYGKEEPEVAWVAPADWLDSEAYLRGVDLYNLGFWWEAHEAWESLWHTTDKSGTQGNFIQGLIQVGAALIKEAVDQPRGSARLSETALRRLETVLASGQCESERYMGLDLRSFVDAVRAYFDAPGSGPWPRIFLR